MLATLTQHWARDRQLLLTLDIPGNCVLRFSEMQVKSKHSEPCGDPCYNN